MELPRDDKVRPKSRKLQLGDLVQDFVQAAIDAACEAFGQAVETFTFGVVSCDDEEEEETCIAAGESGCDGDMAGNCCGGNTCISNACCIPSNTMGCGTDSGLCCSTLVCQNDQCVAGGYQGRIDPNFENRRLFDSTSGEDQQRQMLEYAKKRREGNDMGRCNFPGTKAHGTFVSPNECINSEFIFERSTDRKNDELFEPWTTPRSDLATLLVNNPGLWLVKDLLDNREIEELVGLATKYGDDKGQFGPCKDADMQPLDAHPLERKSCFQISPQNVCEGPYPLSECSAKTESQDAQFVSRILSKFKTLWSVGIDPSPYLKFQRTQGGAVPFDLHFDALTSITMILYLTDGGAQLLFPNANNTAIVPQKGLVVTWLSTFEGGRENHMAYHAVQTHPEGADDRLVMRLEIPLLPGWSTVQQL